MPSENIKDSEIVTRFREEADRIELSLEAMLDLVDLIFGFQENRLPPS